MNANQPAIELNLQQASWSRIALSTLLAGGITFAIFVVMQQLIAQDEVTIKPPEPVVVISSILDIEDSEVRVPNKPKPMPEQVAKPERIAPVTNEPTEFDFEMPEISIPAPTINTNTIALGKVDQQARPQVRIPPNYPAKARTNGIEGFVELMFDVSAAGKVENIQIINAEPSRIFNSSSIKALRKWRYQPKMENGKAVAMHGLQVRLDYTIDE